MKSLKKAGSRLWVIWVGATCFLSGCNIPKKNVVELDTRIKTEALHLTIDTVRVDSTFLYVRRFFVYQDSVLVVVNKPNSDCATLQLYNLETQRPIADYLSQGKGPNEVLEASVNLEGDILILRDFIRKQVAFISMDSLLSVKGYAIPLQQYRYISFGLNRMSNGRTVFENPYCFQAKKQGIDNKAPRFLLGDAQTTLEDFGMHRYNTFNVSQGFVLMNPDRTVVVYASLAEPRVEFRDTTLNLWKRVEGPESLDDIRYKLREDDTSIPDVVYQGTVPYAYVGYCCDSVGFYLAYTDARLSGEMTDERRFPCWIFRFDWAGNFVNSYAVNRYVNALSSGADMHTIYATGYDDEMMPQLLRLTLPL